MLAELGLAEHSIPLTEILIRVELSRAEPKAMGMPCPKSKSSQWVGEAEFKGQHPKSIKWTMVELGCVCA